MGEAARRRRAGAERVRSAPAPELRLVATASEVALASYLVDFAGTMGIARYRSQMAAIAYATRVPVGRLVGKTVEVCQVPDGFPIAERFQDPRTTPPPLPSSETVEGLHQAIAAEVGIPAPAEEAG